MDGFFDQYEAELAPYLVRSPALQTEITIAAVNSSTDRAVNLCHSMVAMIEQAKREFLLNPDGE